MEWFRKLSAYYLLVLFVSSTIHLNGLKEGTFWYWVIAIPAVIGAGWIVEKLDKIK